jgi:putative endonuclease
MSARTAPRAARERQGRRAEWLAAWYLRCKGYRILGTRVRTPAGEIDLVAARGPCLVLVEVKSRSAAAALDDVLSPSARTRLIRAGRSVAARYQVSVWPDRRFDLITITPWQLPRHHRNYLDFSQ